MSDSSSNIWLNGPAKREFDLLESLKPALTPQAFQSAIDSLQKVRLSESQKRDYSVHTGFVLGLAFGVGLLLATQTSLSSLGLYLIALAICHMLEYSYVWNFHPEQLTHDSFLLYVKQYLIALAASLIEFLVEAYLFPGLKNVRFVTIVGLFLAIGGQSIRSIAMWTAGSNFHHLVRERREKQHVLVTSGIYSYFRHPSYFGWFFWAIGTQLILVNPICAAGYAYVLWKFFDDRIEFEEETLISFFGDAYRKYKREVPTRIPFIK